MHPVVHDRAARAISGSRSRKPAPRVVWIAVADDSCQSPWQQLPTGAKRQNARFIHPCTGTLLSSAHPVIGHSRQTGLSSALGALASFLRQFPKYAMTMSAMSAVAGSSTNILPLSGGRLDRLDRRTGRRNWPPWAEPSGWIVFATVGMHVSHSSHEHRGSGTRSRCIAAVMKLSNMESSKSVSITWISSWPLQGGLLASGSDPAPGFGIRDKADCRLAGFTEATSATGGFGRG